MFLYNVWYFFLKISNRIVTNLHRFSKTDKSKSILGRLTLSLFTNSTKPNVVSFRKEFLPTIHLYNLRNNTAKYKGLRLKQINKLQNLFSNNKNSSLTFFNEKNLFFKNYLFLYFIKKNFFRFFSGNFFKKNQENNVLKIIFIFFLIPVKNVKLKFFNLNKYNDWFNYNFSNKNFFILKKNPINSVRLNLFSKKTQTIYKNAYKSIFPKLGFNFKNLRSLINFYFDKSPLNLVNHHPYSKNSVIKFNETSTNKFIEFSKLSDYCFFYIRKNRIFNKGRYSRNRQTYRTGVYWCLWFNIVSVYGLYFIFYRFTFNFGYLWLPLILFFGSFIFSRALKYNFTNLSYIIKEFNNLKLWLSLFFSNIYVNYGLLIKFIFNKLYILKNFFFYNKSSSPLLSNLDAFSKFFFKKDQFVYIWHTSANNKYKNYFSQIKNIL